MAPPVLNQVVAAEKGERSRTQERIGDLYKKVQREGLFTGLTRTYQPLDEEDPNTLPDEVQLVQENVPALLEEAARTFASLLDTVATKDWGNTEARADIVLDDGTPIMMDVPVTFMLFLERELNDIRTFVSHLPTLDPAVRWDDSSEGRGLYQSESVVSNRTTKRLQNHEVAPATDKHPAQVETYSVDVVIGHYNTIRFSGAIAGRVRQEMIARCDELIRAVKTAREVANSIEVTKQQIGAPVMDYIFGPVEG